MLMLNVRQQLPQLDPLIAFEAAARHASFALAARELNVTASAVSQQIRTLEAQLGVALFDRGHRSVQLTPRGVEFQASVSVGLMHLVNAAAEVRTKDQAETLTIATDASIAAYWLMPRLEQFERRHPDVTIRVNVTDVLEELLNADFDAAIVHGDGTWRGHEAVSLFPEEVFPVCAPSYLEQRGGEIARDKLAECALLDLEYERWHWMNWPIWLTERGLPLPDKPRRLRSNNYGVLIDAAKRGAGVALGWRHLLDDDIATGALVRPIEDSVVTRFAYHLIWPYNLPLSAATRSLRDHLAEEGLESPL